MIDKGTAGNFDHHVLLFQQGGGISGSGQSLYSLVVGLQERGTRCSVILGQPGVLQDMFQQAGVECLVTPVACWSRSAHVPLRWGMAVRFILTLPTNLTRLVRRLRALNPDVVYLNTSALVGSALAARLAGLPIAWHVREWLGNDILAHLNCRLVERLANVIIANSDFVAGQFSDLIPVQRVYNGIDVDEFNPARYCRDKMRQELGLDPDQPVVAMLSIISKPKGHWMLLDAAPAILKLCPDTVFLIIGGTSLPKGYHRTWRARLRKALGQRYDTATAFQQDVFDAGVGDHFRFLGFRQDIASLLSAVDVLVFPPTDPEGFGRPLIEAGAMEVPVVASNLGPHGEIIQDGQTGLLVPANDADALAQGVIKLLRDKSLSSQMGKVARQRVIETFTMKQYIQGVTQALEEALLHNDRANRKRSKNNMNKQRKIWGWLVLVWAYGACIYFVISQRSLIQAILIRLLNR